MIKECLNVAIATFSNPVGTRRMTESRRRKRPKQSHRRSHLKNEIDDLVRGMCGGFLFGIPVLYTMEVWWIGSSISPPRLLAILLSTLLVTYLLSSTAGFRKAEAATAREAFGDAVEAIALGVICAAIMLISLRQVTLETQLSEAIGKIILESLPFSLGVALSNQFLADIENSDNQNKSDKQKKKRPPKAVQKLDDLFHTNNLNGTIADISATLIGSVVVAFSIAPTDEVTLLVAAISGPWLLAVVAISLLLSYSIVFQANFTSQGRRRSQKGLFQKPLSETVIAYILSLVMAGVMLIFFQKLDLASPLDIALRQILILGLPATIGGAAGRLVI